MFAHDEVSEHYSMCRQERECSFHCLKSYEKAMHILPVAREFHIFGEIEKFPHFLKAFNFKERSVLGSGTFLKRSNLAGTSFLTSADI